MKIVVPVKNVEGIESVVTTLKNAKFFGLLELGEGMKIKNLEFIERIDTLFFDYIITPDKDEELDMAYEIGARALLAMPGMDIEQIVEAMMFKELDEIV